MASRERSGKNRSGLGRYEEYNGFGELDRESYTGFDDEVSPEQALDYEEFDDDEYYEEEYYDEDEYYEDDYGEDDYEEEPYDYYGDESRRGVRKDPGRRSRGTGSSKSRAKSRNKNRNKGGNPGKKSSRPEKKSGKRRIVMFLVEMLVFIALLVALFIVLKWDKVNKTDLTDSQIYINEEIRAALEGATDPNTGDAVNWGMGDYKNVALFGVDAGGTRSDTIIIASINNKTNEVKMCSVYRDTYLNINSMADPNYTKANAAYAKGGPEQAIRMLNMNLDMNVDDFITVDFDALEDIIDDLGGVEINVQPEEVDYINDYQFSIVMDLGGPKEGKITNPRNFIAVTEPGLQTLNGLQATAYCRIRYTAGSDFRRTERQREVITQIVQKAKGASLTQLNKILDDVLPKITTSFSAAEFAAYASKVGSYTIGETKGFPFENVTGKIGGQSMVVPVTLSSNVNEMHTFFFGVTDYSPTSNVQNISDKVESDRTKNGLGDIGSDS